MKPAARSGGDHGSGQATNDTLARDTTVLDAALRYASLGYGVFPCRPNAKIPATAHGFKDAVTDPERIRAMFDGPANVAIATTALVLDIDVPKAVDRYADMPLEERQQIARDRLTTLRDTFPGMIVAVVATPSGGYHAYLRLPKGVQRPATGPWPKGDDEPWGELRGLDRAYVVAPPSTVDGAAYQWVTPPRSLADLPVASPELLEFLVPPRPTTHTNGAARRQVAPTGGTSAYGRRALEAEAAAVASAAPGTRNPRLNTAAFNLGQLVAGGEIATQSEVEQALTDAADACGLDVDPDCGPDGIRKTIASGLSAGMAQPRTAPARPAPARNGSARAAPPAPREDPAPPADRPQSTLRTGDHPSPPAGLLDPDLNDVGNAERLIAHAGRDLRYVAGLGWHLWTGTHWRQDPEEHVLRLAARTMRATGAAAQQHVDDNESRKAITSFAMRSQNIGRLRAMADLAKSAPEVYIEAEQLDADPYLLNVENGMLNLRTGDLEPHTREALASKLAPVRYDPAARHWAVDALLDVLDRDGRALFLQSIVGQALTGRAMKHAYAWIGESGTAKSTLANALLACLGRDGYAATVQTSTLLDRNEADGGRPRPDLLRLRGARLAVAAELPNGGRLSGETVKTITGSDTITARGLYAKQEVSFIPHFTLVMHSNHNPRADWSDDGLRTRLVVVPFGVKPEEPDPRVQLELTESPDARTAFLAWAVMGAIDWHQRGGQNPSEPDIVRETTREYWAEQDPFSLWAEDSLAFEAGAFAPNRDLFESYKAHAERQGHKPETSTRMGLWLKAKARELDEAGRTLEPTRTKAGRGWEGVRLRGPTG